MHGEWNVHVMYLKPMEYATTFLLLLTSFQYGIQIEKPTSKLHFNRVIVALRMLALFAPCYVSSSWVWLMT